MEKSFSDRLIDGFSEMFQSSRNARLLLIMMMAVFAVVFALVFGIISCSNGTLAACAPEKTVFDGDTLMSASVMNKNEDVALTVFYPEEICQYSNNNADFWASWCGSGILWKEECFAIQPGFERVESVLAGAVPSELSDSAQVLEAIRQLAVSEGSQTGYLHLGEKEMLWRENSGYVTVYMPVKHNQAMIAAVNLIPAGFNQGSSADGENAVALVHDTEVRALLGAIEITAVADIPAAEGKTLVTYDDPVSVSDSDG